MDENTINRSELYKKASRKLTTLGYSDIKAELVTMFGNDEDMQTIVNTRSIKTIEKITTSVISSIPDSFFMQF